MSGRRVLISPSILSADFTKLGDEIRRVEEAGADMIHIDVMDGHFVPNITMGPFVVQAVRRVTNLPIDAHLMIADPEKYAGAFISAGATYIAFHREAAGEPRRVIDHIRRARGKPGLALNPQNPAETIDPYLELIDLVVVMTVNPGFAGQGFMGGVMPKLKGIAEQKRRRSLGFLTQVDGGINPETAAVAAANGADILVAASAIFKADDPGEALKAIRRAAEGAPSQSG
jgi:ribulose-phosphate 3-epimerase